MANSFRLPDSCWYSIEDGLKQSGPVFGIKSALEYIDEHDLSPVAVIYWGHVSPRKPACRDEFHSRGGMFVQDFITALYG